MAPPNAWAQEWNCARYTTRLVDQSTLVTGTEQANGHNHHQGASISTVWSYDNADRVTGITHSSSSAGGLATFTYGWDNASQLTSYTGPEGSLTYTYDNASELTGVGNARSESYSYDLNGNRNMTGWSTGGNNRLTGDGTFTYVYDNEGNLLSKTRLSDSQQWTFTWDFRNRLTQAVVKTGAGVTVANDVFTYDVEDQRIGKSTNGTQTWTFYKDHNPYADFNGSGTLVYRYLYGKGLDQLLGRDDGTASKWYLTDNIGSVRLFVTTAGTILDQLSYDSYGNTLTETNSANGDRFKYTARDWDSEIGLQYNRARYFDPKAGRWISLDPLAFDGGDTDLYRYVHDRPIMILDPEGTGAQGRHAEPPGPVKPGSQSDVPSVLDGTWKVTLCANHDHAWILYQGPKGEQHTAGLFQFGYGNPPVAYSGVQWDQELKEGRKPTVTRGPITVDNPQIYRYFSWDYANMNCVGYAREVWWGYTAEMMSGANMGNLWIWNDPDILVRDIMTRNKFGPPKTARIQKLRMSLPSEPLGGWGPSQ
jgi:RHS repeat-associated protein